MLTKNFYAFLVASGSGVSVTGLATNTSGNVANANGSTQASFFKSMYKMPLNAIAGTYIGTGKKPASIDDYELDARIISGVTISAQTTTSVSYDEHGLYLANTFGVKNTGIDTLEVSEIGLVASLNTTNASTTADFLVERTVLEEPVVIPAGEARQISYVISFPYAM